MFSDVRAGDTFAMFDIPYKTDLHYKDRLDRSSGFWDKDNGGVRAQVQSDST